MLRHRFATLALLLGVSVSSSCGGSSTASNAKVLPASQVAARYGYVSDGKYPPIYVLVPGFRSEIDGYARDLLARRCLAGKIPYPVVKPDSLRYFDVRTNQIRTDLATAEQYGQSPPSEIPPVNNGVAISPGDQKLMNACGRKADVRLRQPKTVFLNTLNLQTTLQVPSDRSVRLMFRQWADCMKPLGIPELPVNVNDTAKLAIPRTGGSGPLGAPSPRETQVAVADVKCRAKVNWDSAILRGSERYQLTEIGRHITEFEAERKASAGYETRLQRVVSELGG